MFVNQKHNPTLKPYSYECKAWFTDITARHFYSLVEKALNGIPPLPLTYYGLDIDSPYYVDFGNEVELFKNVSVTLSIS